MPIVIKKYKFNHLKAKGAVKEINDLLQQLSSTPNTLTVKELKLIAKHSYLIVAKDGQRLIGMATLVPSYQPRGFFGSLQDFVVDASYRGQGLGARLLDEISSLAKKLGMVRVDLTCSLKHAPARELYLTKGFIDRDTKAMRLTV